MIIREPVQTWNLDRHEHTRVSKIKSLDRGTATWENQEPGMRIKAKAEQGSSEQPGGSAAHVLP